MEDDQICKNTNNGIQINNLILILNDPDEYNFVKEPFPICEYNEFSDYLKNSNLDKDIFRIEYLDKESFEKLNVKIENSFLIDKEKLSNILKLCGYRINKSLVIVDEIIKSLNSILEKQYSSNKSELEKHQDNKNCIICKSKFFFTIAKIVIFKSIDSKVHLKRYFNISYSIIENKIPIVILVGGTSGTGKSTVSSILGDIFGIKNVISTDHIRHIIRNFISKEENPVIYASTYDAWKSVRKFLIVDDI